MRVAPFSDKKLHTPTFMPDRDVLIVWTCPTSGSWDIDVQVKNAGTDVDGGDGGKLALSRLGPDDVADAATFAAADIPMKREETEPVALRQAVKLAHGDRVVLRVNSGNDTYGDDFMLKYQIRQAAGEGEEVPNRGFAAVLPDPPTQHAAPGAPLRKGLYWLGTDGEWANSEYVQESIDLVRKFIPELAVVMISGRPDKFQQPAFYRQENIPTIIQTWGSGYEPWLRAEKGFEVNWAGVDLGLPGHGALTGTAHAAALPHPATREAFSRVVQTAIRSGYSGFGYCDMVWMWGGGRGHSGYNAETIAAFRHDLLGEDEGISLTMTGGRQTVFHFNDYANFYLGGLPNPQDLGFKDWNDYSPITQTEFERQAKADYTPDFLLFDLLVHYEWLKFNDFLGRLSREENGFYQCMPNPEDMANGGDLLFTFRLNSLQAVGEEFFNSPSFLDGAYFRFGYPSGIRPPGLEPGIIMEGGGGGNGWPYYANEVAYATAYELALATQAEFCEGDFWPSSKKSLAESIDSPQNLSRCRQLLAYGLGFKDARSEDAARIPPDFVSVTSRRIFRPWGGEWVPWTMNLNTPASPEGVLAKAGFSFTGIGEEGLDLLNTPQEILFYTPAYPTEKGWQALMEKIRVGQIKNLVLMAPALQKVVTTQLQLKPMREVFPDWDVEEDGSWPSPVGDTPLIAGPRYRLDGWETVESRDVQPTVVRKKIGEGLVYCLLFDATLPENAALAAETYRQLLAGFGVRPAGRAIRVSWSVSIMTKRGCSSLELIPMMSACGRGPREPRKGSGLIGSG